MTEQLTRDDIDRLREWQDTDVTELSYRLQRRAIADLLRLHDTMERLRNLQRQDITDEQRAEWLGTPWLFSDQADPYCNMIAAAVRVIVASLDKPAGSE